MIRCQMSEKQGGENSLTKLEAKTQAQVVYAEKSCVLSQEFKWLVSD